MEIGVLRRRAIDQHPATPATHPRGFHTWRHPARRSIHFPGSGHHPRLSHDSTNVSCHLVHVFFMLNRPRFYLLSHPSSMASAYQSLLLVLCFEEICTFGTEEESRSGRAPSQSDRRARSSRPESLGEETTAPQYVYNGHPERAGLPQIALWDRPGGKQNHRKIRRDQWARIRKTALRASNVLRHVPSWEGATA